MSKTLKEIDTKSCGPQETSAGLSKLWPAVHSYPAREHDW
jgi:hypothetical protein